MTDSATPSYTSFNGHKRIAYGCLKVNALAVKHALATGVPNPLRTFCDQTGQVVDIDIPGSDAEMVVRLPPGGYQLQGTDSALGLVGRGAIACNVTHWEQKGLMMTNRKTLKRQYLETTTRAGVYAIRNQITGRALVAGSTNVQGTLNRHRFELQHGLHRNARLAQDWVAHGESNFLFDVLDMVKPSEDPAFNAAQELEMLVSLWRQEIPCLGELGYDESGSKP